ncbi:hypothetical protein Tco_1458446 [Tanacetum coccineum]
MWSLDHLSVSVPSRGLYKTKPPSPRVIKSLIQVPRQGQETRTKNKKTIVVGGHKDHNGKDLIQTKGTLALSNDLDSIGISDHDQADNRQSSNRFRQMHSTELQKHEDEREHIRQTADRAAADSGRQQIQADSSQTADLDSRSRFRQTKQTDACRRNHPNNIQATEIIQ